jgi:hypothetical protein
MPTTVTNPIPPTHASLRSDDHTDSTNPADADHAPHDTDLRYDDASPLAPPLTRRRLDLIVNATPGTQDSLPQDLGSDDVDSYVMPSPVVDRSAYDVLAMHSLINSHFCTDDLRASLFSPSLVIAQPPLYDIDLDDTAPHDDDTHFDKHIADS